MVSCSRPRVSPRASAPVRGCACARALGMVRVRVPGCGCARVSRPRKAAAQPVPAAVQPVPASAQSVPTGAQPEPGTQQQPDTTPLPTRAELDLILRLEALNRASWLKHLCVADTPLFRGVYFETRTRDGRARFAVTYETWKDAEQIALDLLQTVISNQLRGPVQLRYLDEDETLEFYEAKLGPFAYDAVQDGECAVSAAQAFYWERSLGYYQAALEKSLQISPGTLVTKLPDGRFRVRLCWMQTDYHQVRLSNINMDVLEAQLGGAVDLVHLTVAETIQVFRWLYPEDFEKASVEVAAGKFSWDESTSKVSEDLIEKILAGESCYDPAVFEARVVPAARLP